MVTAINPDGIPGDDIHPDIIEASAARIVTAGTNVRNHGATVVTTWQRLSGVYEAPEGQRLFDVITPVGSTTTTVGDDLETVGNALKSFASEVRPIVARLKELKHQAQLFVDTTVAQGVDVPSPISAYQPSSFGAAPAAAPPSQQPWDENQGAIDRNNQLWNQVATQQELLWAAERTCANKIRALYGAAALHSAASEKDPLGYGLDGIPDGTKMPWGAQAERTEGCAESSVKFVFKGVLWDGIVVGGLWGTIKGLGTLVLGYNPQTGGFFSGDAYGSAWSGVGMLAVGLASAGPAGMALSVVPGPVGDFFRGGQNAVLNAGKGLIAWDKWQDDPGAALGESIFNVGTILIPVGAAVTGVKTAGMAARVLSATARVMDAVDPGAWAVKGSLAGIKVAVPSVVDLSKFLRGIDDTGINNAGLGHAAPDIRVPDLSTDTLGWHPDHTGADAPTVETPRADAATVDVPRVDAPPVREPALLGATPHTPDVHAPVVREPATVGAETTPGNTVLGTPHNSTSSHSGGDTQVLDHPTPHTGSGSGSHGDGRSSTANGTDTDSATGHADGGIHNDSSGPVNSGSHSDGGAPHADGGGSHPDDAVQADGATHHAGTTHEAQQPSVPETHPRPRVTHELHVSGGDVPGPRTPFTARTDLLPDTVYHVEGRGDFYTNAHGRVDYVETSYGSKGNLNPDLQRPLPETTYMVHPTITAPIDGVSHAHVFHTDHLARVDYAHTDAYSLGSADRSEWVQTQVGARGGAGYDGGHSFANFAGGGGEYINMEAMLRDLNRGAGDSFFNIENGLRRILDQNPAIQISMTIRKSFSGDGLVPDAFTAVYSIDGGTPIIKIFENG